MNEPESRFSAREIAHALNRSERHTRRWLHKWRAQHEGRWHLNARELLTFFAFYHQRT